MEVKNENAGLLSNLEVLNLLKDIQAGRNQQQKPNKHQRNLATVTYETVRYLERTPCALQSPEQVSDFMGSMGQFQLTKAEKLQLLNSRPSSLVEMHLMVEESEERFTTDQDMERLMDSVLTHLPGPEPQASTAAAEGEEVDGDGEEGDEEEGGAGAGQEGEEDYVAI